MTSLGLSKDSVNLNTIEGVRTWEEYEHFVNSEEFVLTFQPRMMSLHGDVSDDSDDGSSGSSEACDSDLDIHDPEIKELYHDIQTQVIDDMFNKEKRRT